MGSLLAKIVLNYSKGSTGNYQLDGNPFNFYIMSDTRYDKIGLGYNTTRKADPYLTNRIYELL
jgi:hypothetical protein